jgi:hypothetical protein
MSASLKISRPSSLVDLVWPYAVVLDGKTVGRLPNDGELSLEVAAGAHSLQMRSLHIVLGRLGFGSPVLSFETAEGGTARFCCRPGTLREVPRRLKNGFAGNRTTWIGLERSAESVAHHE